MPDRTVRNADVISIRDDSVPFQYQNNTEDDLVGDYSEPIDAQFEAVSGNALDDQGLSSGLGNSLFRGRQYVPASQSKGTATRPANLRQVPMNRRGELLGGIQTQLAGSLTDYVSANPGTALMFVGGAALLAGLLLKKR